MITLQQFKVRGEKLDGYAGHCFREYLRIHKDFNFKAPNVMMDMEMNIEFYEGLQKRTPKEKVVHIPIPKQTN